MPKTVEVRDVTCPGCGAPFRSNLEVPGPCIKCTNVLVTHTIELDCAPMTPRPDTYIEGVLEGTGLTAAEPTSKFFGCWTWEFKATNEDWRERIVPIIRPRIEALYHQKAIRYGGW